MGRPIPVSGLRKRADFLKTQAGVKSGAPGFLVVRSLSARKDGSIRLGITVTRKVGNAVTRNRIRRRLREAAMQVFPENAQAGFDYVVIARAAALSRPFDLLLDDMKRALLRLSARPT